MVVPSVTETESKVKEAILHPVAEVRWTALSFYTKSFTQDARILPLVIEAVQHYRYDLYSEFVNACTPGGAAHQMPRMPSPLVVRPE